MNQCRYKFIDIAKGIGIILVMMGHFFIYGSTPTRVIYAFHMPMFFFLSGLFLSAPQATSIKDKTFWQYIWKKTKRLFLMYCLFFALSIVAVAIFDHKTYPVKRIVKAFLGNRLRTFHMGPIWFLLALYLVTVLYALLHLCRFQLLHTWEKFLLMMMLVFGAYKFPRFMSRFGLSFMPLFINTLPMVLFFVLLGTICKRQIFDVPSVPLGHRILITTVSLIVTLVVAFKYLDFIAVMTGSFGKDLFLFLFTATTGTIAVIFGSSLLVDHFPGRALAYIGQHTMFLLGMHRIVSYYCTKIFYAIFKVKIAPAKNLPNGYALLWTILMLLVLLALDWMFLKILHLWGMHTKA